MGNGQPVEGFVDDTETGIKGAEDAVGKVEFLRDENPGDCKLPRSTAPEARERTDAVIVAAGAIRGVDREEVLLVGSTGLRLGLPTGARNGGSLVLVVPSVSVVIVVKLGGGFKAWVLSWEELFWEDELDLDKE